MAISRLLILSPECPTMRLEKRKVLPKWSPQMKGCSNMVDNALLYQKLLKKLDRQGMFGQGVYAGWCVRSALWVLGIPSGIVVFGEERKIIRAVVVHAGAGRRAVPPALQTGCRGGT